VNDDRFVDGEWHVHPDHIYVAEISYTLDPGLTKLHLTAGRMATPSDPIPLIAAAVDHDRIIRSGGHRDAAIKSY
jgi:hypothetical protein